MHTSGNASDGPYYTTPLRFGQPEWEWSQSTLIEGDRSTPQQTNGCDCGVFMLCTMDLISQGLQVRFDQQQLTDAHFRERIGLAILHSTLAF